VELDDPTFEQTLTFFAGGHNLAPFSAVVMSPKISINRALQAMSILVLLVVYGPPASATNEPSVSTVFAVVVKRLETRTASLNQELTLRTINDVVVDGVIVIPSGSSIIGHVVEFATKGKGNQQSTLAIVIDKAVLQTGKEIPLEAIIAAVAAPPDGALTSDPTYGMMHSNEPKMVGAGARDATRAGELAASSKVESTATLSTARINGGMRNGLLLNPDSQGAIGFPGLSLSWRLNAPPAVSVFNSNKEIKLDAGTQVLLRMAPPRPAAI
jgi:hypothetical protein